MSLFRRASRNRNREIVDMTYASVVSAARNPVFYAQWGFPDTPLGRYESIGLHLILFLRRTRNEPGAAGDLSRDILDEFFKDVDHSIRELGVGDQSVPKRIKKLARMFYGRMEHYWKALDERDAKALGDAVARNVVPDAPDSIDRRAIADYMLRAADMLDRTAASELLTGAVRFPEPAAALEG